MEALLYPDNEKRANRCDQLMTIIQTSITDVKGNLAYTEKLTASVVKQIEERLKREGQYNIGDMLSTLDNEWANDVKENYERVVAVCKDQSKFLTPEATIFAFIASVAGTVGLTATIIDIFKIGTGMISCKLVVRAVVEFSRSNFASGFRLLKYCKSLSRITSFRTPTGLKVLKVLKWGGNSIAAVALFLDIGLAIYTAFAGAQNRTALQSAIKDLCMRRFTVRFVKCLHSMYRDTLASSKRLVIKQNYYKRRLDEGKIDQGEYDTKVERLVKNTVKEMKKDSKDVDFDYVWDELEELDKSLKAFTHDDPSKSDLRSCWDDGEIKPQLDQAVEEKLEEKLEDELQAKSLSLNPSDFVPDDNDEFDYAESLANHGSETDNEESEIESESDTESESESDN